MLEEGGADALDHPRHRRAPDETEGHRLVTPVQGFAQQALSGRHGAEQGLAPCRRAIVHARHDPAWRALEYSDLFGDLDQLGNDLNSAGTGPDHSNALALQVIVVVPAGAVDALAFKGVDTGNFRQAGVG